MRLSFSKSQSLKVSHKKQIYETHPLQSFSPTSRINGHGSCCKTCPPSRSRIGKERGEGEGELKSHRSTISTARRLIRRAKVKGVTAIFELGFYGSSRRVDLAFVGKKPSGQPVILLLELKDFDNSICLPSSEEDRKEFKILTDTYGLIEHPSLKAKIYQELLLSSVPNLQGEGKFSVLSFAHAPRYNWELNPVLYNATYAPVFESHHCFDRETEKHLVEIIREEFSGGHGGEALHELLVLSEEDDGS